jgi:hypothetical protein
VAPVAARGRPRHDRLRGRDERAALLHRVRHEHGQHGALATPIAFLLTAFLLGFAVVIGAELNNAIDEVSPAPATAGRRERLLLAGRTVVRRVRPSGKGEA